MFLSFHSDTHTRCWGWWVTVVCHRCVRVQAFTHHFPASLHSAGYSTTVRAAEPNHVERFFLHVFYSLIKIYINAAGSMKQAVHMLGLIEPLIRPWLIRVGCGSSLK